MKLFIPILFLLATLTACQKEDITLSPNADDVFYVRTNGQDLRVNVQGNTLSGIMVVIVHGGPGGWSSLYNTPEADKYLESNYAVAYYDQRSAGGSQGNAGNLSMETYSTDLKNVIAVLQHRYNNAKIVLLSHSFGGLLTGDYFSRFGQNTVSGWINCDGPLNFAQNSEFGRQYLISYGEKQIALGNKKDEWTGIVNTCKNIPAFSTSSSELSTINQNGHKVEDYIDSITNKKSSSNSAYFAQQNNVPAASLYTNKYISEHSNFIKNEIQKVDVLQQTAQLTLPRLFIYGNYDFVCPKDNIKAYKNIAVYVINFSSFVFAGSGHSPMINQPEEFNKLVAKWIKDNL